MTIRQYAEDYCYQRGMFPDQAKAVIDAMEFDYDPMKGRWNALIDSYPGPVRTLLTMAIDQAALEWIDVYAPLAWYRPMFVTA